MQIFFSLLLAAAGIVLDRLVKAWCVRTLAAVGSIPLWNGVFHLTYAENIGAGFSILSGQRWLLVAVTGAVLIALILLLLLRRIPRGLPTWAVACIISGAAGNLIDRIRQGYVVDLFDFRAIHFAIFNVADVFICVGAGLIVLWALIGFVREKHAVHEVPHD